MDIKKRPGVEAPMKGREIIGTIRPTTYKGKDGKDVSGYVFTGMVNANDEKQLAAAKDDPSVAKNLNLTTKIYKDKDGKENYGHSQIITQEQGDALIKAAGKNNAPYLDKEGAQVKNLRVIAFQSDLTFAKSGKGLFPVTGTAKASELESFGKSSKKAAASLSNQYETMAAAPAPEKGKAAERTVDAPEAQAEAAQDDMAFES